MLESNNNLVDLFQLNAKINNLEFVWLFSVFALTKQSVWIVADCTELKHTLRWFEQS